MAVQASRACAIGHQDIRTLPAADARIDCYSQRGGVGYVVDYPPYRSATGSPCVQVHPPDATSDEWSFEAPAACEADVYAPDYSRRNKIGRFAVPFELHAESYP